MGAVVEATTVAVAPLVAETVAEAVVVQASIIPELLAASLTPGTVVTEAKAELKAEVKDVEPAVITAVEKVTTEPTEATNGNVDHDYEDVTPLNSIAEDLVEKERDSFVETKEEIVDDLEFIKAKLT